jgi:hypothetical protein
MVMIFVVVLKCSRSTHLIDEFNWGIFKRNVFHKTRCCCQPMPRGRSTLFDTRKRCYLQQLIVLSKKKYRNIWGSITNFFVWT